MRHANKPNSEWAGMQLRIPKHRAARGIVALESSATPERAGEALSQPSAQINTQGVTGSTEVGDPVSPPNLFTLFGVPAFRRKGGFTLIELLVVISIIGVLAGLIVGLSGVASYKGKEARVRIEMNKLMNAIENYKSVIGS